MTARILLCMATLFLIDSGSIPAAAQCTRCGAFLLVNPKSLVFPPQTVGARSVAMTISLRSVGIFPVTLNRIVRSGRGFSQTNNCPSSLPRNAGCRIQVVFFPRQIGTFSGAITLHENVGTQVVTLSGSAVTRTSAAGIRPDGDHGIEEADDDSQDRARYAVVDLGTLGGTFSAGLGINDRGWVSGVSTQANDHEEHSFLWRHEVLEDLGTLGGPNSIPAFSPFSERGEIGGAAETTTPDPNGEDFCGFGTRLICRPVVWHDGKITRLRTLGGSNGVANQVNNRGQVVGVAENRKSGPDCFAPNAPEQKPVLYDHGNVHGLPTIDHDPNGVALAINDRGLAVGFSFGCSDAHAILWQNGRPIDLGNLGGSVNHVANAINDLRQVVGQSNLPGDEITHAFLWQQGKMRDLGTLTGDSSSAAIGINNQAQVVGASSDTEGNERAFLWERGTMRDLNTLTAAESSLFLLEADSINAGGEIVGFGFDPNLNQAHGFLAIPCDGKRARGTVCRNHDSSPRREDGDARKISVPENIRSLLRERMQHRVRTKQVATAP